MIPHPVHTSPILGTLDHVAHGFFGRPGGVSTGIYEGLNCGLGSDDDPADVAKNRARVATALEVPPESLITLYQIHSAKVEVVSALWAHADAPQADAMITDQPGIALGVLAADCGPLLFADQHRPIIATAHAGWQGALKGVIPATIAAMESLGAKREDICASLGPCISQTAYEVGPEFRETFVKTSSAFASFFEAGLRDQHWQFDLPGFVRACLEQEKVGTIEISTQCTYQNPDTLYSYRRTTHLGEPDYGRNISVLALNLA